MGLQQYITSDYITAANRLKGGRRRIVAFVESYDDVAFWSQVLRQRENEGRYFEVMLPSRNSLAKGKRMVLANQLGPDMIACVDADYDWLLQGRTTHSREMCGNPYVLHTYAYAIENLLCYSSGLHEACVKATLNDAHVFPFADFLEEYSRIIWPLFVWNVWAYRYNKYKEFSLSDFAAIVCVGGFRMEARARMLEELRRRVNKAVSHLQHRYPEARDTYAPLRQSLLNLGLTPDTTYLYMRGHDLMDGLVLPLLEDVCNHLHRAREREILALAVHEQQKRNELSAYRHACSPVDEILRKYTGYTSSEPYQKIMQDAARLLP